MKHTFTPFAFIIIMLSTLVMTGQKVEFGDLDVSPMDAAHYPRRSAFANYLDADDADRTQKIKVLYSRPGKKDRNVFGGLLKFGELWRLGANEATEVTFYTPVEIGGKTINTGTYTMLAEVNADHWNIIISTERFVAGSSNLDASKHIAKVKVPTSSVDEVRESFTIGFQKVDEGNVNMIFEWDQTKAVLPINLNAPTMDGPDKSPMDLVQYPDGSRFRNFAKPEDLDKNVAKVRVVYSRPQMKGRKIFGDLVKYGDMWRVGANQTTELTFFQDVVIGGKEIRAGKYGLFATVNKDEWEFLIHKNVQSWGSPNHDASTNVVSVSAKVEKTPKTLEAMSIALVEKGSNQVDLVVGWENSMARLPITIAPSK